MNSQLLKDVSERSGGVLKTSDAVAAGVSKPTLAEFVKSNGYERVAHGIYLAPDAWADGMYLLQLRFPSILFSHDTALFLHGLTDQEPLHYTATVKTGYNPSRLKESGAKVYTIKRELFDLRCEVLGLEQAVFDTLKAQMDILLSEDGAVSPPKIVAERPAYERQIEALGDEKMRLYESYQLGEIELSVYKARKEILDAEQLKAKNAYAALTAQAKRDQDAQAQKAERRGISRELSVADDLTAELVDLLIDKVYVFPDKRIEIAYKVKDFST